MDFVLPDQFVDRTNQARHMTFFEKGIVAHLSFADPVCGDLRQLIKKGIEDLGLKVHFGRSLIFTAVGEWILSG